METTNIVGKVVENGNDLEVVNQNAETKVFYVLVKHHEEKIVFLVFHII